MSDFDEYFNDEEFDEFEDFNKFHEFENFLKKLRHDSLEREKKIKIIPIIFNVNADKVDLNITLNSIIYSQIFRN